MPKMIFVFLIAWIIILCMLGLWSDATWKTRLQVFKAAIYAGITAAIACAILSFIVFSF